MAKLDLYEQEQMNKVKYFFHDYGKYIIVLFAVVIIGYLASFFWGAHKQKQAVVVATLYEQFNQQMNMASNGKNNTKIYTLVDNLQSNYPKFTYTTLVTILAGTKAHKDDNLPLAAKLLNWAVVNASDNGLANIARLELVNVYVDQHKFAPALALLAEKHDIAFDVDYYNSRGDLYLAQGKLGDAKEQYQAALRLVNNADELGQLLHVKLEILGN